jgi:hypothetical protein
VLCLYAHRIKPVPLGEEPLQNTEQAKIEPLQGVRAVWREIAGDELVCFAEAAGSEADMDRAIVGKRLQR